MKKKFLLLSVLITCKALSQDLVKSKVEKKNTISFEFYQPIQNNIREFYNDDWLLSYSNGVKNNFSRKAFTNAFGICYERINNEVVFRTRFGLSIRDIKEHQSSEQIITEQNIKNFYNQDYRFTQNHLNLFFGIAKRASILNNFYVDFGIDIASVFYLKGRGNYEFYTYNKNTLDDSIVEQQLINVKDKIGNIYSFGIGPVFKPQYEILNNLIVSAEIQVFFMKTFTNETSRRVEISDREYLGVNIEHIEIIQDIKYDINQWNWTKVSPLIRIGYQF